MGAVGKGANLRVGCCHKKVEPFGSRFLAVFELGGRFPGAWGALSSRLLPFCVRLSSDEAAACSGASRCFRAFRDA